MNCSNPLPALVRALLMDGWRVTLAGAQVRVQHPTAKLSAGERQGLQGHNAALLDLVGDCEEKAGLLEYMSGYDRAEAERVAWQVILSPATPKLYTPPVQDWYTALAAVPAWPVQLTLGDSAPASPTDGERPSASREAIPLPCPHDSLLWVEGGNWLCARCSGRWQAETDDAPSLGTAGAVVL